MGVRTPIISPTVCMAAMIAMATAMRPPYKLAPLRLVLRIGHGISSASDQQQCERSAKQAANQHLIPRAAANTLDNHDWKKSAEVSGLEACIN